jgi:hypothetical protein
MFTQVGNFIQDNSSGRQTRIKDAINRRYDEIARGYDWPDLIRLYENEITVTSGEANVYMPRYVDVIKKIVYDADSQLLRNFSPEQYFARNFDQFSTTGNAFEYSLVGSSAIKREVASAETLDLVSSDAGDTGLAVQVWGLVGGDEINETVTLDGTSAQTTTNSFSRITKIGTDATSINGQRSGVITISGTTSSTEYATIVPQDSDSRYQAIRLQPVPTAATTLTVIYKKRVVPLINDSDTLELEIGPAVVELAIADILRQQHKWQPARDHDARGEKILLDYKSRYLMQSEQIQQSYARRTHLYTPDFVVIKGR